MTYFNQWDISNHDTSRFKSACVLELALLGTLGPPPYEQSWASLLNDERHMAQLSHYPR